MILNAPQYLQRDEGKEFLNINCFRLQSKMKEERPRSADINKMNAEERSAEVRSLREQIVDTFKTQMKLRRKLMDIDAHLLGEF